MFSDTTLLLEENTVNGFTYKALCREVTNAAREQGRRARKC